MRTTNYTLQRAINICHSLNTEQIKVQISRKSTLCSVQIICTVNQVSGICAPCKVPFIKNAKLSQQNRSRKPRGGDVQLYSFFNLGDRWCVCVCVWSEPRPGRFNFGKDTVPLTFSHHVSYIQDRRTATPQSTLFIYLVNKYI